MAMNPNMALLWHKYDPEMAKNDYKVLFCMNFQNLAEKPEHGPNKAQKWPK